MQDETVGGEMVGADIPHNPWTRRAALTDAANLVKPSAVRELCSSHYSGGYIQT